MSLNRRYFLSLAAGTTAALAAPAIIGMAKPRVIVIGGGCRWRDSRSLHRQRLQGRDRRDIG